MKWKTLLANVHLPLLVVSACLLGGCTGQEMTAREMDEALPRIYFFTAILVVASVFFSNLYLRKTRHRAHKDYPAEVQRSAVMCLVLTLVAWELVFLGLGLHYAGSPGMRSALSLWLGVYHPMLLVLVAVLWYAALWLVFRFRPRWTGARALWPRAFDRVTGGVLETGRQR